VILTKHDSNHKPYQVVEKVRISPDSLLAFLKERPTDFVASSKNTPNFQQNALQDSTIQKEYKRLKTNARKSLQIGAYTGTGFFLGVIIFAIIATIAAFSSTFGEDIFLIIFLLFGLLGLLALYVTSLVFYIKGLIQNSELKKYKNQHQIREGHTSYYTFLLVGAYIFLAYTFLMFLSAISSLFQY